ncbi:MAG: hypothetical protein Q9184_003323 [Pyrenodesmia sp. 2 TL-2023]
MHIRRAVASDSPTTATFSVPAFLNDELYRFSSPFAAEYPEDFRNFFLQRQRRRHVSPGQIYWVAVLDQIDEAKASGIGQENAAPENRSHKEHQEGDKVVGYALWSRYGDSEEAKRWQKQTWAECRS